MVSTAATSTCIGVTPAIKRVIACRHEHGHDLWLCEDEGGSILFCNKCKGYVGKRGDKLTRPCEPVLNASNSFSRIAAARLRKGVHPTKGTPVSRLERLTESQALGILASDEVSAGPNSSGEINVAADSVNEFVEPVTVELEEGELPPPSPRSESEPDPFGWGLELD